MAKREFTLQNLTYALADAQDAIHLNEQKERLEQAVINGDAPLTLDTAKTLLETIFKTVLTDRLGDPNLGHKFPPLYKKVREELKFNENEDANSLLGNLGSTIVHNVSELRNKFGAASHGDDGYFETPIQMNDAEMIAHVVDGLAGFIYGKHKHLSSPESAQRIYYSDYPTFNNYLDEQYPGYKLELGMKSGVDLSTSEIIFMSDETLYREMLIQFRATEESDTKDNEQKDIEPTAPVIEAAALPKPQAAKETRSIDNIANALILNDEVRHSVTDKQCIEVAEFVRDYANNKAGLDWQNRDSLIAKFRIQLKRQLIKVTYSEAFIDDAIELLIDKAAQYYPSEYSE